MEALRGALCRTRGGGGCSEGKEETIVGPPASSVHHSWVTVVEVFGVLLFSGIAIVVVGHLMDLGADALRRLIVQRRQR